MGYRVDIKGLPQLRRRLADHLPKKMRDSISTAMAEGAGKVVGLARTLVPVDSGELLGTIRATPVRVSKRGGLVAAVVAGDQTTVENGFQKSRLLEFGTQKMAAQPFLLPAFRSQKRSIRAAMSKAAKKAAQES